MIARVVALVAPDSFREPEGFSPTTSWGERNSEQIRFAVPISIAAPAPQTRLRIDDVWPAKSDATVNGYAFILGVELRRESFARNVDSLLCEPVPEYVAAALTLLSEEFLKPDKLIAAQSAWQLTLTDDHGARVESADGKFVGINRVGTMR